MQDYVRFSCEHCFFKVKTSSKNVGKPGKCPNCEKTTVIPDDDDSFFNDIDIMKDLAELG